MVNVGPIVVIMGLAAVSTMCDKLMDRINLLSTECTPVEHLTAAVDDDKQSTMEIQQNEDASVQLVLIDRSCALPAMT